MRALLVQTRDDERLLFLIVKHAHEQFPHSLSPRIFGTTYTELEHYLDWQILTLCKDLQISRKFQSV